MTDLAAGASLSAGTVPLGVHVKLSAERITEMEALDASLSHNWCEEWLYEGIRHLVRNCFIGDSCSQHADQETCPSPDAYDGKAIAQLRDAFHELLTIAKKEANA